jgi:hypothetical protein
MVHRADVIGCKKHGRGALSLRGLSGSLVRRGAERLELLWLASPRRSQVTVHGVDGIGFALSTTHPLVDLSVRFRSSTECLDKWLPDARARAVRPLAVVSNFALWRGGKSDAAQPMYSVHPRIYEMNLDRYSPRMRWHDVKLATLDLGVIWKRFASAMSEQPLAQRHRPPQPKYKAQQPSDHVNIPMCS